MKKSEIDTTGSMQSSDKDPYVSSFVKALLQSQREMPAPILAEEIPSVVQALQGDRDGRWVVFAFHPIAAPGGQDSVNLQYSVEGGGVGLDWVLLSSRNVLDQAPIAKFIASKGFEVSERQMNGVRYLRVEGPGIEALGIAIVAEFYQTPPERLLGVIKDGVGDAAR
jgi:hypothetical protein